MTLSELRETSVGRFTAEFSDGSELRVDLNIVTDFSLYKGRELTDEEYEKLSEAAQLAACKNRALKMIGLRPMSCKELFDKLVTKGETEENAELSVQWLLDLHYMDDAQYAQMLVRHYAAKGYGIQKIKNELYSRGVPKRLWDEALAEMPETDEKVYELLLRKLKSSAPDRAELKKATDALYRRGYSWDEIKAAVSRFQTEHEYD